MTTSTLAPGSLQATKTDRLSSYLNDHLAGSVAALELIDHLLKKLDGENPELSGFLRSLRRDIAADQELLRELIGSFSRESIVRKAAGWIGEKAGRIKLAAGGEKPGELGLLEALEVLSLGITGKRLLWSALGAAKVATAKWLDLHELERRAEEQWRRVEHWRLDTARAALGRKPVEND